VDDDHPLNMNESRALRLEIWLAALALAVLAVAYRYAWTPGPWEEGLQFARDEWRIAVGEVGRWFSAWTIGDGQLFAVIAADPLGLDEGWEMIQPAFRYWRAGFGWLAWAASLGQESWVPYGMAIVGAASIVSTFLLTVRLRPELGKRAWFLVFNPAVLIAFAGDTAEGLGVLALAYAIATGRAWVSAALGVIRPSFLIALVGRWRLFRWGALTALVTGVWWIFHFGWEASQYGSNFALPFVGYGDEPSLQSLALGAFASATIWRGWRNRDWAWVASGIMVVCFSGFILADATNGWRVAGMLYVLWAFGPGYQQPPQALPVSDKTVASTWQPKSQDSQASRS